MGNSIKQFADTSAVSLAYTISDAANADALTEATFHYIPFTTEGFQLAKESQQSTAITNDRRPAGSKNTRGTASGNATIEFGHTPFVLDMLKLAMMGQWQAIEEDDGEGGSVPTGEHILIDGEARQFFVVEKRTRNDKAGDPWNYFDRYFGNLVNEASIEVGASELITMSVSTTAAFGDIHSANAATDPDAGGLASEYVAPSEYEIADSANNVKRAVIKDANGEALEVTFSDFSISVGNNVREQAGVGHEFAAGMAMGKVQASVSGTVYYYDDTVLKTHLENGVVSFETSFVTEQGEFTIIMPRLKAGAPNANAQGENQDYTQSMELTAERGTVTAGGKEHTCVMAILHKPA